MRDPRQAMILGADPERAGALELADLRRQAASAPQQQRAVVTAQNLTIDGGTAVAPIIGPAVPIWVPTNGMLELFVQGQAQLAGDVNSDFRLGVAIDGLLYQLVRIYPPYVSSVYGALTEFWSSPGGDRGFSLQDTDSGTFPSPGFVLVPTSNGGLFSAPNSVSAGAHTTAFGGYRAAGTGSLSIPGARAFVRSGV